MYAIYTISALKKLDSQNCRRTSGLLNFKITGEVFNPNESRLPFALPAPGTKRAEKYFKKSPSELLSYSLVMVQRFKGIIEAENNIKPSFSTTTYKLKKQNNYNCGR